MSGSLKLDALHVPSELMDLVTRYDINSRVAAYMDYFAYNLEDRLVALDLGTTTLECCSASLEDVVASKLYSDRDSDALDIRRPEVLSALGWSRLAEVVDDMQGSKMNDRRHSQMLRNYRVYRQECGPCGD